MTTDQIDTSNPLDMSLSDIKTERPLIKPGILADFKVVKCSIMTNESKTFRVELEALSDLEAKEGGGTIPAARAKLFDSINTEPTGKSNWELIQLGCARFIQGTDPSATIRIMRDRPEHFQGMTVRLRVGYQAEGTGGDGIWRGAQNRIAEYLPKKA